MVPAGCRASTPSRVRTGVAGVKDPCPGPLDDGGEERATIDSGADDGGRSDAAPESTASRRSGGGIRTPDLLVMSQASYRLLYSASSRQAGLCPLIRGTCFSVGGISAPWSDLGVPLVTTLRPLAAALGDGLVGRCQARQAIGLGAGLLRPLLEALHLLGGVRDLGLGASLELLADDLPGHGGDVAVAAVGEGRGDRERLAVGREGDPALVRNDPRGGRLVALIRALDGGLLGDLADPVEVTDGPVVDPCLAADGPDDLGGGAQGSEKSRLGFLEGLAGLGVRGDGAGALAHGIGLSVVVVLRIRACRWAGSNPRPWDLESQAPTGAAARPRWEQAPDRGV